MNCSAKNTQQTKDQNAHPWHALNRPGPNRINNRRLVPRASERRSKMIAFGYYGGKFSHLEFILPLLPAHYTHFCEPFGGSAAVLINRPPAPVETYNDLDGEVVNFFECLRDDCDKLIRAISLTPFSRQELVKACTPQPGLTALERARRFFVRARQTRTGLQIENVPAAEIILRYDSPQTLFYLDPPYPHEARGDAKAYGHEMSDREHEELAELLHAVRGAVAVSSYLCPLMESLYRDWRRVEADTRLCHSTKGERTESVWLNYDPQAPLPPSAAAEDRNLYLLDRPASKRARVHAKK